MNTNFKQVHKLYDNATHTIHKPAQLNYHDLYEKAYKKPRPISCKSAISYHIREHMKYLSM